MARGEHRLELGDDLVDREARGLLPRRELLECGEELRDQGRRRQREVVIFEEPVPVGVRRHIRPLVGIGAQVEQLRDAQDGERLEPDLQRPLTTLLHEDDLPVVESDGEHVAVVGEVHEALARALVHLAGQVRHKVVAVDVHLVRHVADRVPGLQLLDHVRLAGGRQEGRQPVVVLDDLVRDDAGRDLAGPADHLRHAEGAFPVGVLLATERRHPPVRPRVHVRTVVGAVDDDRVLRESELVQLVQQGADDLVVVDHRVVVGRLPAAGLSQAFRLRMRAEVHVRGVEPDEERRAGLLLAIDEVDRVLEHLVVDRLHALLRQRPGVLDPLLADPAPALIRRVVVGVRGPRMHHATRRKALAEAREVLGRRVVRRLRLLLGVQVVEVAEELVEPVRGWEKVVLVAQMVLAELSRRISQGLEQLGDRRVLGLQSDVGSRHPDLAQTRSVAALSGDERGAAGGAALLAIGIGEAHPLVGDAVDVRRAVSHQSVAVAAQVADSDVVSPDDEDVRLLGGGHAVPFSRRSLPPKGMEQAPSSPSLTRRG